MKNFSFLLILLASLIVFQGCKTEEDAVTESTSAIDGTWQTGCYLDEQDYMKQVLVISAGAFTATTTGYSDATCTTGYISQGYVGNFTYGATGILADGEAYTETDQVMTQITQTSHNDTKTDDWNSYNVCGFSDWQTDVEKDISAVVGFNSANYCDGPPVDTTFLTIYSIQNSGTELYMGDLRNATDNPEVTRVTSLSTLVYIKQ